VAGVLSFPGAAARGRARLRLFLDGLTIASALLSVSWATVLGRVYASGGDSLLSTALSLAYPISDVAIGTMLLVLAMRTARGGQSAVILLTLGLGVTAIADSAFAYLTAAGTSAAVRRLIGRERQRQYQASHDPLTDLANRVRFYERVTRALAVASPWRQPSSVAVLFIDLDDFEDVNDRLGHQVGDQLLAAVADRLRRCVRPSDVPARLDGAEFAVLA